MQNAADIIDLIYRMGAEHMPRFDYTMSSLLDIPLWEKVQDQLAKLTGTAIITIDLKGVPVTKHSCRTEFCSVIRENPVSRKRCYRCDALAGLEAVRAGKPYIYLCHCGIVDVAVPVMVGDTYLGAVMFGQVRLRNNAADVRVERLVNEISSFQAEGEGARQDLLEMYERLPEMDYERIVEIADLINSIVGYIVDRAIKSRNERQTYDWLLSMDEASPSQQYIQELKMPGAGKPAPTASVRKEVKKDSPLYPALSYIENHPTEAISMKQMANLCHLSESYFSRLFSREMGENFGNFVSRMKVDRSKELLRSSRLSVTEIAKAVGYQDASHYIRLFKRFEGVTPTVYRQYNYK